MTDKQFYKEMKKEIDGLLANDPSLVITVTFLQRRFRLGYNRAFDYAGKLYWDDYNVKFNGDIPKKEVEYLGDYRAFEGKLMTTESINKFPDSLEKEHILKVREMLTKEGFNPDDFRVDELPIEGTYYFEKAIKAKGVDYFSVYIESNGELTPQYTTMESDENGYNTFPCETIRDSISKTEC